MRVRRRDGAALLLVREDRVQAGAEGSLAAARAMQSILGHLPADLAKQAVPSAFPWTDVLPDDARDQFITDFVRAFQASAELDQWSVLTRVLHEWRSTAAIFADPALFAKLTAPVEGDFGPVPPPIEE
ncbi:hypothetical protein [Nocardia brevicatena]|uniref:hypothetical protein n=1 Tax=Nocardia brevicatena TaxID=37327 RepID=UPI000318AA1F|nr:hypothetical protein [Nocardia brevicatena]